MFLSVGAFVCSSDAVRSATMTSHIVDYDLSDNELHMGLDNGTRNSHLI
jgi:hypothetical protein